MHEHVWDGPTDGLPPVPPKRVCSVCGLAQGLPPRSEQWVTMGMLELTPTAEAVIAPSNSYPMPKGAGWWLLSDGSRIRGSRDVANQQEAALHA